MDSLSGYNHQKIAWLNEEFELLKRAVNALEREQIEHKL